MAVNKSAKRRSNPVKTKGIEREYQRSLTHIARHIGELFGAFPIEDDFSLAPTLRRMLEAYSETLDAWAKSTASKMIMAVDKRDREAWLSNGKEMSRSLQDQIRNGATSETLWKLMSEQVTLIKSLPLEAAQRVHDLTIKGLEDSTRASEIRKMILESGQVTKSRAQLIARTEVARTSSKLTEARAKNIGSTHYIWRTSHDSDVRSAHKAMDGKVIAWAKPPTLPDGSVTHAGQIYNCRCYPEPIIEDD